MTKKLNPKAQAAAKAAAIYLQTFEESEGKHFVNAAYLLMSVRLLQAGITGDSITRKGVVSMGATFGAKFVSTVAGERGYSEEQRLEFRDKLMSTIKKACDIVLSDLGVAYHDEEEDEDPTTFH